MHYGVCILAWKWGTYCSLHYPEAKQQLQQQYPTLMNYIAWGYRTTGMAPVGFCYNLAFSPTAHVPDLLECIITSWTARRINLSTPTDRASTEWCHSHELCNEEPCFEKHFTMCFNDTHFRLLMKITLLVCTDPEWYRVSDLRWYDHSTSHFHTLDYKKNIQAPLLWFISNQYCGKSCGGSS